MSSIHVGIMFLIIGIGLLPIGIIYLKQDMEGYKELSPIKKVYAFIFIIIDVITTPVFSGWILYISLIFIGLGTALIFLV